MATQHYSPAPSYGAPIQPPAGKFNPRIGLPEIIALEATTGKVATSQFGASEIRLQLTDGRPWYVALAMSDVIRTSVAPRQQIEVTKTGKGPMDWRIIALQAHLGAANAVAQAAPAAIAERVIQQDNTRNDTPPPPPAAGQPSQLMACFAQAIDAIQEAQQYANRKGLGITFTSEDVRATAISCWIQCGKGGR